MSATDLLRIHGSIELHQFWPSGDSDADTSKLLLRLNGPVEVRLAGSNSFQSTSAYDGAYVVTGRRADGDWSRKFVIDQQNRLTVRLQRVDAPELHYKPDARGSGGQLRDTGLVVDYRQHQAETATVQLANYLRSFDQVSVPVSFTSELKATGGPGEAIDKYGRFVGDVILPDGTNLNLWLLEQGLAIPALYDSMLPHEIDESVAAVQAGRRRGIVRHYSPRFLNFDPNLRLRGHGVAIQNEGARKFIHPKYFRRQATWYAWHTAGIFSGDFGDWLEHKAEEVFYRDDFRQHGRRATRYPLYERASDGSGVGWAPEDFIFLEAPSTLYHDDAAGQRSKVKDW